jgi:pimeloyl-ACP methyl ester carboxylesterase
MVAAASKVETRSVAVREGLFAVEMMEAGSGAPLVYLHGVSGLDWNEGLDGLASRRHVFAPRTPGYGESSGNEHLFDLQDLTYFYLDLLDTLGLEGVPLVGHSLGGMIAAEIAAAQPQRFSHLVLVAPLGLWSDAHPVMDYFTASPRELARAMYANQELEAAQRMAAGANATMPEGGADTPEGQRVIEYYLERNRSMATAAKYLWPIPNRGLRRRIHRVTTPTLVIWGERDGFAPPAYAADFVAALPNARAEMVAGAAHEVGADQGTRLASLVNAFIEA